MNEKMKLEALIDAYLRKIEEIGNGIAEENSDQFKEVVFEDYALASGSITYAKLSGVISEDEAKALKEKISAATKEIKDTDYIF